VAAVFVSNDALATCSIRLPVTFITIGWVPVDLPRGGGNTPVNVNTGMVGMVGGRNSGNGFFCPFRRALRFALRFPFRRPAQAHRATWS
jgi:hypothetical protein